MKRQSTSKRAASSYQANAGVGADGVHTKVLLDFSTKTCTNVFCGRVEGGAMGGRGGRVGVMTSSSQHASLRLYSEECHE